MIRLPNLLASRKGRLAAFFALYMTEGIPLGFAATAVATQLRRQGVGPAEIGAFVGSFYLPWAFKWAFGPIIDTFASDRLGRRRGWVLITQLMMALTLVSLVFLDLPAQLALFTGILLIHNTFGAMQDVAIDALACNTLQEDERGVANGMMFAGAYMGQAVGGSGVLFLTGYTGFQPTFLFVAAAILVVTTLVVLPMKEAIIARAPAPAGVSRLKAATQEMSEFAVQAFRSFLGTRGAFAGVFFGLLPAGAMCLGLALQSNLAVELGMSDDQFAVLQLWSTILSAAFCVAGGWLSDRFGRRKTLFVYLALMSLPVAWLAVQMQAHDWVMPRKVGGAMAPETLIVAFWATSLAYAVFQGLMYGTRSAAFMDVTNPKVAATQFTAYMALMNLAIAYSATWQGIAIEAWGYPVTMAIDAVFGLACLCVLPFLKPRKIGADAHMAFDDGRAAGRAKLVAFVLGLGCLAWLPVRHYSGSIGAALPIVNTAFTLVFVGSALFLLASAALMARSGLTRLARILAALLLAMYVRNFLDKIAGWLPIDKAAFLASAEVLLYTVPAIGGLLLLSLATRPWRELGAEETAPAALAVDPGAAPA